MFVLFTGKAFSYDKSLKEHKYMHESEKHFKCNVCGKTFRQKASLQIHSKVHKETKDYICQSCGKGTEEMNLLFKRLLVSKDLTDQQFWLLGSCIGKKTCLSIKYIHIICGNTCMLGVSEVCGQMCM